MRTLVVVSLSRVSGLSTEKRQCYATYEKARVAGHMRLDTVRFHSRRAINDFQVCHVHAFRVSKLLVSTVIGEEKIFLGAHHCLEVRKNTVNTSCNSVLGRLDNVLICGGR